MAVDLTTVIGCSIVTNLTSTVTFATSSDYLSTFIALCTCICNIRSRAFLTVRMALVAHKKFFYIAGVADAFIIVQ